MKLKLYSYYRSSAAYRVRIALNLKGIAYQLAAVNLLGAEHRGDAYLALNPQGLVPALDLGDGRVITQSPAILEWLDSSYPEPPLLPDDPYRRARVRSLCSTIACDIHPLNNLRVLDYLESTLNVDKEERTVWYHHWIDTGFSSLELQVGDTDFCAGDQPGMADIYLVPQIFNALRFRVDMAPYPHLYNIYLRCQHLEAFARAHPDEQPDRPAV